MSTDNEIIPKNEETTIAVDAPARPVDRYRPRYSSEYSDDHWEVRVSMPGVEKSDVNISIENEILTVTGHRKMHYPESWKRLSGSDSDREYQLKLDVGPEVDDTKIEAKLENGELLVRLPLKDEAKPRQIPVS
ncbi:MAG: Hsp20/alpha crystallin family protein [Verrucomicrobiales bacterium]|nr:Hsp20/alpha crystallin family protein [Verrucomicrobiales bacterium]